MTLQLHEGMLPTRDFQRLSDFEQLTEIIIDKGALMDLYDFGRVLEYSPKVETVDIDGFKGVFVQH